MDSFLISPECVANDHVDMLGPLPSEWWGKREAWSRWFTEDGRPKEGREVWTGDQRFMECIQDPRRKKGMEVLGEEERTAFCDMIRGMLAYRPSEHLNAKQVLASACMRNWAMPEYEEAMSGCEG